VAAWWGSVDGRRRPAYRDAVPEWLTVEVFDSDERLERYRTLPVVRAALDAVPDHAHGLLVYRGRGGGSGALVPRRPRPRPAAVLAGY
jgi:hypothetical protein